MTSRNAGDEIGEILSNLVWDTYERDNLDYRPDFDKAKAAIEHYTARQVREALEKVLKQATTQVPTGSFHKTVHVLPAVPVSVIQQAITDSGTVASKRGDV
jgi:D-Tyr-tRNAtyr deacylase